MEIPKLPDNAIDCANYLLASLPKNEYQMLKPHLEYFPTPAKTVIYEKGKKLRYIYFPLSGAHSVLAFMEDGAGVEIGTIGKEGFSSVDVLIGATASAETTICQIPGASLRMPVAKFNELRLKAPELERLCFRFLQAYLSQVSQSVACNRLHSTEERFARWILISHDRMPGDSFHLTQEFLADMLGVHRPSVTLIARGFQQAGYIKYSRGVITVLNRTGLEGACCECYGVVRKQFQRVLEKSMS